MAKVERAVIISHTMDEESKEPVNQIDNELQRRGFRVIHDVHDYGNKRSIELFMKHIERGNCVVLVISDSYLRESRSMFVIVEIANNRRTYDRVFPVVLEDANIFSPIQRIEYIKYWEEKRAELAQAIKTPHPANSQDIQDNIDLYDRIRDIISGLTSILKGMNALTPDMHRGNDFSVLYDAIEKRMGVENQSRVKQSNIGGVTLNASGHIEEPPAQQTARAKSPPPHERPIAGYRVRVVAQTSLNVREGPGSSFPVVRQLKTDDVAVVIDEQQDKSGNVWACIGPNQWIVIRDDAAVRIPDEQDRPIDRAEETRKPEYPAARFEYRHKGVNLAVAYTSKGWRMENIDGLFVASIKFIMAAPIGSFFGAVVEDIPSAEERTRLQDYLQNVAHTLPEGENSVALPMPSELGQILLPFSQAGKVAIIAGITSSPLIIDDEAQREAYVQGIIHKSMTFAGINGIRHLVMPFIGDQTESHVESTIQTLVGINDFGSLQDITLVTYRPSMAKVAKDRFELLNAQQRNWQENNRPEAFANDLATGEDQLNITSEVYALTDSLLLRDAEPPLAAGIIGSWGSGKSFVMHLIKERIKLTRTKPVKLGWSKPETKSPASENSTRGGTDELKVPSFAGHIYMVKFNAWTYAKSNLWASLMQTIFFEINRQISLELLLAEKYHPLNGGDVYEILYTEGLKSDDIRIDGLSLDKLPDVNALWNRLRESKSEELALLQTRELELAAAKNEKDSALQKREKEIDKTLGEQVPAAAAAALKQKVKSVAKEVISQQAVFILEKQGETSTKDVEELINEIRSTGSAAKNIWNELWKNKVAALFVIVFVLFVLFGVPWLENQLKMDLIYRWMQWLIAGIPVILPLVRIVGNWTKRIDEIVQEYQKIAENERKQWEQQRENLLSAKLNADEQAVLKALENVISQDEKQKRLKALAEKGNLNAHERLIKELESQVEVQRRKVGPTGEYVSLLDFVRSRLSENSYESQLGLMHQIKQDMDELTSSLLINDWDNNEEIQAKQELFPRGAPRIVLFIDDLDRCPPSRVVEVMEAVQLLLSTELFVVVLGIDTRYVTRALEKEYKEILQHEGDPSGLDYIEKIIQIPYRVRPIEEEGLKKYLEGQMKTKLEEMVIAVSKGPASQPISASSFPQAGSTPKNTSGDKPPANRPKTTSEEEIREEIREEIPEELLESKSIELPAAVIKFKPEDIIDLNACCQKVSLTPRSVKRLVNVLKLMKIFWFRTAKPTIPIEEREPSRAAKQAAITLLALSSAYPEVMRQAFVHIDNLYRQEKPNTYLFTALEDIKLPPNSHNEIFGQFENYKSDLQTLRKLPGIKKRHHYGYITLKDLTQSTFNLVRSFSFVGDPVFWTDGAEVSAPLKNEKKASIPPKRNTKKKTDIK